MRPATVLKRTPLHDAHVALGARMAPFAGWEMPIQYPAGILAEVRAVRSRAGIFDVSHMGRIEVSGRDAPALLDRVLTQDVLGLKEGRARYALLCNEDGGILDDTVVYRMGQDRLLLVCNAGNRPTVWQWLRRWAQTYREASLQDVTEATVMVALQGPQSPAILERLAPGVASSLRPFAFTKTELDGEQAIVSRTGYTGEDGFEFVTSASDGTRLWDLLRQAGGTPCGLGARDVLRLEAALLLHGADMDTSTNPFEAGLERFVNLQKGPFVGRQALLEAQAKGVQRRLVGFVMVGRGIARSGCSILSNGQVVGRVTSGGPAPTLDKSIGLGYVATQHAQPGARLWVDIRGNLVEAVVVPTPFYTRRRSP